MLYLCLVLQPASAFAETTNRELERVGIKAYNVPSFAVAQTLLSQWRFDIVLLDADVLGERVYSTLTELARFGLPIVTISSEAQEEQIQIRTLELGATEVVARSTSMHLTALRLRKLADIRRGSANPERPAEVRLGSLVLDTSRVIASVGGIALELTPRQFDLLLLLTQRAGEFVHRQTISMTISRRGDASGRSVDMMVSRIRRRLREVGDTRLTVHTIYGRGYCLTFEDTESGKSEEILDAAMA